MGPKGWVLVGALGLVLGCGGPPEAEIQGWVPPQTPPAGADALPLFLPLRAQWEGLPFVQARAFGKGRFVQFSGRLQAEAEALFQELLAELQPELYSGLRWGLAQGSQCVPELLQVSRAHDAPTPQLWVLDVWAWDQAEERVCETLFRSLHTRSLELDFRKMRTARRGHVERVLMAVQPAEALE